MVSRVPVRAGARGMSLAVAMSVVAIMAIIASTMAAVSMMSLDYTQRWTHASVALHEAEAGIAELLYSVADDPQVGKDGVTELRSRLTEGYDDRDCGHVVTFRRDGDAPWSVNNLDGTSPEGYGGRTVPAKMVHAWSVGRCRGVVRTLEVLIEKPPFPYALATSGRIVSKTPLVVEGTRSMADFAAGRLNRPGHVCANSTLTGEGDPLRAAIRILADASASDSETYISGFARSAGGIRIDRGVVVGGVRPQSGRVMLPDIEVADFRMAGAPGVFSIGASEMPLPSTGKFVLDVMYDRDGNLTLNGPVVMRNAFLFVKGDLTVRGSLTGSGAVVATGSVTINGDARLEAGSRVALLCGGKAILNGSGNLFQGLVYAKGGVSASRITVLGNIMAAGGAGSDVVLDRVRLVSSLDTTRIDFTARSSSNAIGGDDSDALAALRLGGRRTNRDGVYQYSGELPAPDRPETPAYNDKGEVVPGAISDNDTLDGLRNNAQGLRDVLLIGKDGKEGSRIQDFRFDAAKMPKLKDPRAAAQISEATGPLTEMNDAAERWRALQLDIERLSDTEGSDAQMTALRREQTQAFERYTRAAEQCARSFSTVLEETLDDALTYDANGKKTLDVRHAFDFDLDRILTDGARLKVVFWRVHGEVP